ncbi:MAG: dihydrofolate reductase, partial [Mucinivorans sp.]
MINIIVAVGQGGVIGYQNRLLWHISEDLKHFKSLTMGHPIIMGRKTFESLGRALPARLNIVVSRQSDIKL